LKDAANLSENLIIHAEVEAKLLNCLVLILKIVSESHRLLLNPQFLKAAQFRLDTYQPHMGSLAKISSLKNILKILHFIGLKKNFNATAKFMNTMSINIDQLTYLMDITQDNGPQTDFELEKFLCALIAINFILVTAKFENSSPKAAKFYSISFKVKRENSKSLKKDLFLQFENFLEYSQKIFEEKSIVLNSFVKRTFELFYEMKNLYPNEMNRIILA